MPVDGAGLGLKFLKHIERTQVLLFLIDGSLDRRRTFSFLSDSDKELEAYNPDLLGKSRLVVVNKMDLPGAKTHLAKIQKAFKKIQLEVIPISAKTGEGIPALIERLFAIHANRTLVGTPGRKVNQGFNTG